MRKVSADQDDSVNLSVESCENDDRDLLTGVLQSWPEIGLPVALRPDKSPATEPGLDCNNSSHLLAHYIIVYTYPISISK